MKKIMKNKENTKAENFIPCMARLISGFNFSEMSIKDAENLANDGKNVICSNGKVISIEKEKNK